MIDWRREEEKTNLKRLKEKKRTWLAFNFRYQIEIKLNRKEWMNEGKRAKKTN